MVRCGSGAVVNVMNKAFTMSEKLKAADEQHKELRKERMALILEMSQYPNGLVTHKNFLRLRELDRLVAAHEQNDVFV